MRTFHFTPQMKNFRTKLLLGGLGNLLLVFVGVCTALAAAALIASAERQTDSYIILALIIAAGVLLALPSIRPITYQFRQYRQLGEPDRKRYENETSVNGLPLRRAIIEGKIYRDDSESKTVNSSLDAINKMLTNGKGDLAAFVAIIRHLADTHKEYAFWGKVFYTYSPDLEKKKSAAVRQQLVYYFSPEFSRRDTYVLMRDEILKAGKQEFAKWLLAAGI